MSIYKRIVRGKPTRNYYIDYVDEHGRSKTVSSKTSDKRLAAQYKAQLVDRAHSVRAGLINPQEERFRLEADKPLAEHVGDYLAACEGRGDDARWVKEKTRHLDWFQVAAGGCTLSRIRPDDIDMRLTAESEGGSSARTVNLLLETSSSFLNWCVRNGRLRANPLRVLTKRNTVLDVKRKRRVLTAEETQSLIRVAREQARTVDGAELRALWYLFPLLAGLRRGDLGRMCWRDVDLESTPACLTIRGGKARKRVDRLPLHAELVRELRAVRPRDVLPSARVFPALVTHTTRGKDFQRAGIVEETDEGHADLHALRHTFGTRLAEKGVPPAKLQRLMRHATYEMTMRYYVHLDVQSLDEGLSSLAGIEEDLPGAAVS